MIRLTESVLASRPLVVLVGPTAVGKSDVGLRLARALETDLLTADSRQVYRGMDIATDKPAVAQRQGVPDRDQLHWFSYRPSTRVIPPNIEPGLLSPAGRRR